MKKNQILITLIVIVVIVSILFVKSNRLNVPPVEDRQSRSSMMACQSDGDRICVQLIEAESKLPIKDKGILLTILTNCKSEWVCESINFLPDRTLDDEGRFSISRNETKNFLNIENTSLIIDIKGREFSSIHLKLSEIAESNSISIERRPSCEVDKDCQNLDCSTRTRFHPMPVPKCIDGHCECGFNPSREGDGGEQKEPVFLFVDNMTGVPIPNLSVSLLIMAEGNWESGYLAPYLTTNSNGNIVIKSEKVGKLTGKNVRITIFVEPLTYHSKIINQTFSIDTPITIPLVKVNRCVNEKCNSDCSLMKIRQAFHCYVVGACENDKCNCNVKCAPEEG